MLDIELFLICLSYEIELLSFSFKFVIEVPPLHIFSILNTAGHQSQEYPCSPSVFYTNCHHCLPPLSPLPVPEPLHVATLLHSSAYISHDERLWPLLMILKPVWLMIINYLMAHYDNSQAGYRAGGLAPQLPKLCFYD